MPESSAAIGEASNFRTDKYVLRKIGALDRRIPFRDLVKLASPRKAEQYLAAKTGSDPRSARRWLRGDRAPASAVYAVLADIMSRME